MATITATSTGNWSDTTVWDLGRAPLDGDLVLAVSYTITFDVDVAQPNSVLNATSGNFRHSGAGVRNVTANANVGNHSVGGLIQNTSSGTLNWTGAITGGSGSSAFGAYNAATGTITITTCTGGSGTSAYGAYNAATGTITITTCTGGSSNSAFGAVNNAAGTITITTCTGGSGNAAYGAYNAATGTITITTCTGGSGTSAFGAVNIAAGTIQAQLAVGNDYGPGGTHAYSNPGIVANNSAGQITSVKAIQYGVHGQSPTSGPVQIVGDVALNHATFVTNYSGGTLTLLDATAAADFPDVANVRSGTSFDNGDKTGTCAVPTASQVAYGVPVDNTTGMAVLTAAAVTVAVWDAARSGHATDGTFGDTAEWAGSVDEAAIATAVWTGPDTKQINSVSGSVGSIATGGITSASFAAGAITATAIAADAIGSSELAATAAAEIAAAVIAGGAGTYSYSNTVDDGSGNLLDGAYVELATDSAMTNVVNATHTNSLGAFTVYSDTAGAHYLRITIGGYEVGTATVTLA